MRALSAMKLLGLASLAFAIVNMPMAHSQEFDYTVVYGEWGAYERNLVRDDWYTYLQLGSEGGTFSYSYSSDKAFSFHFDESQVRQDAGLLLINLTPERKCPMRLVVSAFRTEMGSALLTGSLYMFRCKDGESALFNTIPQRMTELNANPELADQVHEAMSERNGH